MVPHLDLPVPHTKLQSSILQAPKLELKLLPDHLKYIFLGKVEAIDGQ